VRNFIFKLTILSFALLVSLVSCTPSDTSESQAVSIDLPTPVVSSDTSSEESKHDLPDALFVAWVSSIYSGNGDSVYLEYYDDSGTKNGVHRISLPTNGGLSESFVCSEVMAVVGNTETNLKGFVSHDSGKNWSDFQISLEPSLTPETEKYQIGFTSEKEGWIVYQCQSETGSAQCLLFQTNDGGRTWIPKSTFKIDDSFSSFKFASADVGWALPRTVSDESKPLLYQTFDGGATWELAAIQIYSSMEVGAYRVRPASLGWKKNQWVLSIEAYKSIGYPSLCQYSFVWNVQQNAWIWNNPNLDLPEGIDPIGFIDYVEDYLFPPEEYSENVGLGKRPDVFLLYNTVEHLARMSGENTVKGYFGQTIPFEDVEKIAFTLYGDELFSARVVADYWKDEFGIEYNEKGFVYEGHWLRDDGQPTMEVQLATSKTDGSVEVVLKRTKYMSQMQDYIFDNDLIISYQKCIFVPTTLDGIQYFTLMSSEVVSPEE
jgi:hypothetical protein